MARLLHKAVFFLGSVFLLVEPENALRPVQGTVSDDCGDAASQAEKMTQDGKPQALSEALKLYQQSLNCGPASLQSERRGEVLLKMGRVQLLLEKTQDALDSFSSAAEIFLQVEDRNDTVQRRYATALLNQAVALGSLRRMDDSLPVYNQARDLFHSLSDKPREAFALGELSRIHFLMGDNQSALVYCSKALALRHRIDAKDQDNQRQKATLFDYKGRIYAQMNESELARSYFQDALAIAKRTSYYRIQAYTLNDLGALLLRQHKPERSERIHQQALDILNEHEPGNTDGIAETKMLLADAQAASGKYESAKQNYRTALFLQEKSGDEIGQAETHFSLGLNEHASGRLENALTSFRKASEIYHRVHDRAGESNARFQVARIYALQRREPEAQAELDPAIHLAEEIRNLTPGFHLRTTYFASLEKMYRFGIDLILQHQGVVSPSDQTLAFDLLQHAQSRALVDTLESRLDDPKLVLPGDLFARREKTLRELQKLNRKLQWVLADESRVAAVDDIRLAVKRLEASLAQVEAEAEAQQPRLALLSGGAMSLADIQHEVLDENSALIQFYLSNPSSFAWVITKSDAQLVRLPAENIFTSEVRSLLKFGEAGRWTSPQREALATLDHNLAPIFTLAGNRKWIVVPDGVLYYFPFGLLSMQGEAGSEAIKIPSVSAVRALRTSDADPKQPFNVAVFADPVFDAQDSRVKAARSSLRGTDSGSGRRPVRQSHASYSRLLYSRREAQLIASLAPPKQVMAFLDFAARPESVRGDALKSFKIIHFATHSLIDSRDPELSRIVLSLVSENGAARPGFLLLKDIYRMRLASNLVVLSSCQSAIGQHDVGEGPMSLSRGFLFAGSKSVLATLWTVDDEVTAEFIGRFYQHLLKEKLSALSALTKTQFEFRHHPVERFHNPYYWAGFELYGDWLAQ